MDDRTITWKTIRFGQVRPYADSIYEFEIESNLHERKVKEFCTEFLRKSNVNIADVLMDLAVFLSD